VLEQLSTTKTTTTTDYVSRRHNTNKPFQNKNSISKPKQNEKDGKEKANKEKKISISIPTFPSVVDLTIPTPIFLASLPKSGTTSIAKYFNCGGQRSSHHMAIVNGTLVKNGRCMEQNIMDGRPTFEGCGDFNVWTDTGYVSRRLPAQCYYPAIEGLEEIYQWYPNSTLMLATRDTKTWQKSASKWSSITTRWESCELPGFTGTSPEAVQDFYEWHKELVRNFARNHPSMTFIEVALEDPTTPFILEKRTGVPASCFAKCKPEENFCRQHTDDIAPS
jgi:hypothetical protein